MKRINKYISLTLLLITASLAVGCNKVQIETDSDGKHLMDFSVASVDSKAYVTKDNISSIRNSFKVYAYYTNDFEKVDGNYILDPDATFSSFNDVVTYSQVTENSTTVNKWVSSGEHYWEADAFYRFRAYFPGNFPATITDTDASTPSFRGYSIEPMPDDQVDILMAETSLSFNDVFVPGTDGQPDRVNPVPLTFKHLLSKIYLQVKMDDELADSGYETDILAAAFRGVTRTANYNGQDWVEHTGTTDVGMNFTPSKVLTLENNLVDVFNDGILVIPQEVTAGVVTAYIHAVLPIGGIDSENTIERPLEIVLPAINKDDGSSAWEPGKQYTYIATITAEYDITLSAPSVAKWETGSTSGTVIIK